MSTPARGSAAEERCAMGVEGLRRVHLGMIDTVLAGRGFARLAELAAEELGGAVAIVLPALEVGVVEPPVGARRLSALAHYVTERQLGRPVEVPGALVAEVPIVSGHERLGSVVLLDAPAGPCVGEVLELAALAALTAVALQQGASLTQRLARAGLLEDLRADAAPPAGEVIARAKRLGCDLSEGAAALCVQPAPGDAERVLAVITEEIPRALAAAFDDRVDALLPPSGHATAGAAQRLARRLRSRAPTGLSPFESNPADLPLALRVAELALLLGERDAVALEQLLSGSWRLLLRAWAADPRQLEALVESTVGPALGAEDGSPIELLDTLRAYLDHGANMNATAAAIYAHRHTIAYRLARIRELTGHDPQMPSGQAQLALGLQALAIRESATARSSSTRPDRAAAGPGRARTGRSGRDGDTAHGQP